MNLGRVVPLAVLAVLLTPMVAQAWGPATHVELATDLLGQLHLLPAAVAAILTRYRKDYMFGNIAADVVVAKRLSRVKQICHHWKTGFAILDDAQSDKGRAFAYGYLSHLAADTVSHNKFLPRQMTLTHTSMSFGHLYWELRADALVDPASWERLSRVLDEVFAEHEAILQNRLTDTFLPFVVNWRVFYRMNRFLTRRLWRQAMVRWYDVSRWQLSENLMRAYRAECLERMVDMLTGLDDSPVCHEDPNGNMALSYTKLQRRQLRQMARAGLIAPHILYEAAIGHGPTVKTNVDAHRGHPHVR